MPANLLPVKPVILDSQWCVPCLVGRTVEATAAPRFTTRTKTTGSALGEDGWLATCDLKTKLNRQDSGGRWIVTDFKLPGFCRSYFCLCRCCQRSYCFFCSWWEGGCCWCGCCSCVCVIIIVSVGSVALWSLLWLVFFLMMIMMMIMIMAVVFHCDGGDVYICSYVHVMIHVYIFINTYCY